MSSDVGRNEVRVRVSGMKSGNLKPPGYFKQLPVMTQDEFLSWPPSLLNLLPMLLPDPVIATCPPLAEMAFAGFTGSLREPDKYSVVLNRLPGRESLYLQQGSENGWVKCTWWGKIQHLSGGMLLLLVWPLSAAGTGRLSEATVLCPGNQAAGTT